MHTDIHVSYPYSCQLLIELEFSRQTFGKFQIHENPSSYCWKVPFGRTDITKQIVAFRNVANWPKSQSKREIINASRSLCKFIIFINYWTRSKFFDQSQ